MVSTMPVDSQAITLLPYNIIDTFMHNRADPNCEIGRLTMPICRQCVIVISGLMPSHGRRFLSGRALVWWDYDVRASRHGSSTQLDPSHGFDVTYDYDYLRKIADLPQYGGLLNPRGFSGD